MAIGFSFEGGSAYGFVQASQFRIASGEKPLIWGGLDTVSNHSLTFSKET